MPVLSLEDGSKILTFEGTVDALKLATNYSIWEGKIGHVTVEYRVQPDEGRQSLQAVENITETGIRRETTLFRGYASIYFLYSDTTDPDMLEEWTRDWDYSSKPPAKVKLVLVSAQNNAVAFTIPVRVTGVID